MSEYRKQIIVAVTVAIIVAASAGFGILYLPTHNSSTMTTISSGGVTTTVGSIGSTSISSTSVTATPTAGTTIVTLCCVSTTIVTSQTSSSCSISGEPYGLMIRIVSDSTLQPVVGAIINATNNPALCDGTTATTQTSISFTTNGTMWYTLPTENDDSYTFNVNYTGQIYHLTAGLEPMALTCATLDVPSGRTNVTTLFQSSCSSNGSSSTTTVGTQNCPNNYPSGIDPADAPAINVQESSPAYLCVRYYYYNPNSTMQILASNVFGVAGYRQFNSTFSNGFDGSSNFTIMTSSENITLGGPDNLNEGILVQYDLQANPNSNGTYNYGFQATIYPSLELCNGFGPLVVGNGVLNYNLGFGSCTAPLSNPRNAEGFVNGILFVEVVGVTNSTS